MKIAIDLDMTLNDMAYTWADWIRLNIDPKYTLAMHHYHGWVRDAYGSRAEDYWKNPAAYKGIAPLPGARYFLLCLKDLGHEIFILTHTPDGQRSEVKDAWIRKHFFYDLPIVHSGEKFKHSEGCLFIDDHPGHAQAHVRAHPTCKSIIFNYRGDYGWAHPLLAHDKRISWVSHYDQILALIDCWEGVKK